MFEPKFTFPVKTALELIKVKLKGICKFDAVKVVVVFEVTRNVPSEEYVARFPKVTLPATVKVVGVPVAVFMFNVPTNPVVFNDFIVVDTVTYERPFPELESKYTSSADVGTLAPVGPPEVADQLAVLFQFPEAAPLQNLVATCYLH